MMLPEAPALERRLFLSAAQHTGVLQTQYSNSGSSASVARLPGSLESRTPASADRIAQGMIHTVSLMRISARRRRQFVRGFRLAGNLLLGFVTLAFVAIGATVLTGGEPGRFSKVGDCIALLAGFWILFARADDWKTWVAGFFGFPGLCSGVGILISGHMAAYPYKPVPQKDAILILVFCSPPHCRHVSHGGFPQTMRPI